MTSSVTSDSPPRRPLHAQADGAGADTEPQRLSSDTWTVSSSSPSVAHAASSQTRAPMYHVEGNGVRDSRCDNVEHAHDATRTITTARRRSLAYTAAAILLACGTAAAVRIALGRDTSADSERRRVYLQCKRSPSWIVATQSSPSPFRHCVDTVQREFPNVRIRHDFTRSSTASSPLSSILDSMIVVEAHPDDLRRMLESPDLPTHTVVIDDPPRYAHATQLRQKQHTRSALSNAHASHGVAAHNREEIHDDNNNGNNDDDSDDKEWGYNSFELNTDLDQQHYSYGLEMLRIPRVWEKYRTKGENVTVCVVDTGLDTTHEEFRTLLDDPPTTPSVPRLQGWSPFFRSSQPWSADGNGHGTHVTGILAAQDANHIGFVGVAPGVNLVIVRIFQDNGRFYSSDLVEAFLQCASFEKEVEIEVAEELQDGDRDGDDENNNIEVALPDTTDVPKRDKTGASYSDSDAGVRTVANIKDEGATGSSVTGKSTVTVKKPAVDFINLSLGGPRYQPAEHAVVNCLSETAGIGFIAAAGNTGSRSIDYPAGYDAVLSVTAVNSHAELASFSTVNKHVDIAGPGVEVWSTFPVASHYEEGRLESVADGTAATPDNETRYDNATLSQSSDICIQCGKRDNEYLSRGYGSTSGTSMATPYVTGIAALAKSAFPQASSADILEAIARSTTDLGQIGKDESFGHGLVDGMNAVTELERSLSLSSNSFSQRNPSVSENRCQNGELEMRLLMFGETGRPLEISWRLVVLRSILELSGDTIASHDYDPSSVQLSQSSHSQCLARDECYRLVVSGHKVVGYSVRINGLQHAYQFYTLHLTDELVFGDGCPSDLVTRQDLHQLLIASTSAPIKADGTAGPTLSPVEFIQSGTDSEVVDKLLATCSLSDLVVEPDSVDEDEPPVLLSNAPTPEPVLVTPSKRKPAAGAMEISAMVIAFVAAVATLVCTVSVAYFHYHRRCAKTSSESTVPSLRSEDSKDNADTSDDDVIAMAVDDSTDASPN